MSLLFSIIYAAHANGTHHKLALDALRDLPRADAEPWRRVFLKHVEIYLAGSKAPDDEFKDFKNHVLHVRDKYWGGAPEKAHSWYGHVVEALQEKDFERAVYAAGVLSHYYTDPIHPFHSGQSDAENQIHRAVEWSINRSYDSLRAEGLQKHQDVELNLPAGSDWLRAFVIEGAERGNRHYETLIAHYDFKTGVREPTAGLNPVARDVVAQLLIYASKGFARVLDRALTEAAVEPPEVSLSAETVLATLKVPAKWVTKKIADAGTRRQVQAMYDELMTTGRVEATLPEDDRTVRDLHAREVLAPRAAAAEAQKARRLAPVATKPKIVRGAATLPPAFVSARSSAAAMATEVPPARENGASGARASLAVLKTEPHSHLSESDDLEKAPSIGPKLAERLALGGIATVGDFLNADPHSVVTLLGGGRYDTETVEQWKAEARLVLQVPGLRGTHAQLLAGAGYETATKLAGADPVELSSALLHFAGTAAGARILRSGDAPDIEAITRWVQAARQALAA